MLALLGVVDFPTCATSSTTLSGCLLLSPDCLNAHDIHKEVPSSGHLQAELMFCFPSRNAFFLLLGATHRHSFRHRPVPRRREPREEIWPQGAPTSRHSQANVVQVEELWLRPLPHQHERTPVRLFGAGPPAFLPVPIPSSARLLPWYALSAKEEWRRYLSPLFSSFNPSFCLVSKAGDMRFLASHANLSRCLPLGVLHIYTRNSIYRNYSTRAAVSFARKSVVCDFGCIARHDDDDFAKQATEGHLTQWSEAAFYAREQHAHWWPSSLL